MPSAWISKNVKEFFDSIFGDIGDLLGRKAGRSGPDLRLHRRISLPAKPSWGRRRTSRFDSGRLRDHLSGQPRWRVKPGCASCAVTSQPQRRASRPWLSARPSSHHSPCRNTGKEGHRRLSPPAEAATRPSNNATSSSTFPLAAGTAPRAAWLGRGEPGRQGGNSGDPPSSCASSPHPLIRREGVLRL